MQKNKLTIRKVIKDVVKSVNDSVDVKIECKEMTIYCCFRPCGNGKIETYVSKGFIDVFKSILDLDVDSYELDNSTIPTLNIHTDVFAERFDL